MSKMKMIVKMCWLEHVPIEQSQFQQTARAWGMEEAADRLSYEIEFPRDAECSTISNTPLKQQQIS